MTFFPKKCKKVGKLQLFKNRNKNENKSLEIFTVLDLESKVMFKVTKCARDEVRGFLLVQYIFNSKTKIVKHYYGSR